MEQLKKVLTKDDLVRGLRKLGVTDEMIIEVHCAMHAFGYVIGGAQTVVDALLEAVGPDGTVVMTIQASDNTEPSFWIAPPISRSLWKTVRETTPPYKPDETEFRMMGSVVRNFNRRKGVLRSSHPCCAFAAYGKYAEIITKEHEMNFPLGDKSPLGVMYMLPTYILLLGVGYDNCTGMHLGETRSNVRRIFLQGSAIEENGRRKWIKYIDYALNSDEFVEIGQKMEKRISVRKGKIGNAECRLFSFKEAVDFTDEYLKEKYPM